MTSSMRIGCHVSISGNISNAVDNAVSRRCTAFQIFTSNPRGWYAKELVTSDITNFCNKLKESDIDPSAICAHMPYLPNLASPKDDGFAKSVGTLKREVTRCGQLGIPYLVTHMGSHLGSGEETGIKRLTEGLTAGSTIKNNVTILLENTAGQKNSVGSDFEQLGQIFQSLKPQKRYGICLDTCHAFAAGYDLRTRNTVKETFAEFDEHIGIKHLKIIHLNDSKGDIGSNLDRHYHLGLGMIGEEGISEVIKIANDKHIPVILETPIDAERDDIGNLKKARDLV